MSTNDCTAELVEATAARLIAKGINDDAAREMAEWYVGKYGVALPDNGLPVRASLPAARESERMVCGHPASEVVSADEGTAYCAACEREARGEAR